MLTLAISVIDFVKKLRTPADSTNRGVTTEVSEEYLPRH
jgi:hypothetical protein